MKTDVSIVRREILFFLLILVVSFWHPTVKADDVTPTVTPTDVPAPTATLTPTPSQTPTQTPTPSLTPTPSPTGSCADYAPGSAPAVSVSSTAAHSVTLTWTKASGTVTYYLLSYGVSSGQYIYGNPNIGDATVTSYTVGNLSTGKKYYFVIRAGNGCAPGPFSSEVSAVPGGVTPTAVATSDSDTVENADSTVSPTAEDTPTDTPTPSPTMVSKTGTPVSSATIVKIFIGIGILMIIGPVIWVVVIPRFRKRKRISFAEEMRRPQPPQSYPEGSDFPKSEDGRENEYSG